MDAAAKRVSRQVFFLERQARLFLPCAPAVYKARKGQDGVVIKPTAAIYRLKAEGAFTVHAEPFPTSAPTRAPITAVVSRAA